MGVRHFALESCGITIGCRCSTISSLAGRPTLDTSVPRFVIRGSGINGGTFFIGIRHFAFISRGVTIGRGGGTIGTLGGWTALDTTKTRDIIR